MQISDFFMRGDMRGAIEFMRSHAEFAEILPAYEAIFEREEYIDYEVPELLNRALRTYQAYYRELFYFGLPEAEAADMLRARLRALLEVPEADEEKLTEKMETLCADCGLKALFGKTQGIYGPYIWRETVPTTYHVTLPCGTAEYTVNILRDFVFRGWMAYLTFGSFGTGGWASADGTINCVEDAYDFESERFLVSLLKHEAQHTVDMKAYPAITPTELEYRAKLVELHYSADPGLLGKFFGEADQAGDANSHAAASARIRAEFSETNPADLEAIRAQALALLLANDSELSEKYGG